MNSPGTARDFLSLAPRTLGVIVVAALALAAGVLLGGAGARTPAAPGEVAVTLLEQPRPLGDFRLVDHAGQPFTPDRLVGRWSLIYFGYTRCPDLCPATMASLKGMHDAPGKESMHGPLVVFVTMDPQWDTPARLKGYVSSFHDDFVGVTGSVEDIEALANRLGIVRVTVESSTRKRVVDHSLSILVTGPDGTLRAVLAPPHDAQRLVSGFEQARRSSV